MNSHNNQKQNNRGRLIIYKLTLKQRRLGTDVTTTCEDTGSGLTTARKRSAVGLDVAFFIVVVAHLSIGVEVTSSRWCHSDGTDWIDKLVEDAGSRSSP